jgi:hypothetical protein
VITPDTAPADALELWRSMAQLARGDDIRGYPLLTLCAALTLGLQGVDDLARDTAAGPGWSQILDVNRAPDAALPWLAQWVGARVDPALSPSAQRAAIAAEPGFGRGTPAAIIAAAQKYLTGGQVVRLVERDQGDPYLLTVYVFGPQVGGASYGSLSQSYPTYADLQGAAATYAGYSGGRDELAYALQAVKPAGLVLNLVFASGQLYSDLAAGSANYNAVQSAYPTYDALTNSPPGS